MLVIVTEIVVTVESLLPCDKCPKPLAMTYMNTEFPGYDKSKDGIWALSATRHSVYSFGTAQVNGAPEDAGIIPRAVIDIFKRVDELRTQGIKASVCASFLEV